MSQRKVQNHEIEENVYVFVKGTVQYSRVASVLEGEELEKSNERSRKMGRMYFTTVPHTNITINNASVVPKDRENPKLAEIFVQQRLYNSDKYPERGRIGNFENKNPNNPLPKVFIKKEDKDGKEVYEQITLERELDNGVQVKLALKTFKPKNYANKGIALEAILIEDELRYYDPSGFPKELEERGIILKTQPEEEKVDDTNKPDEETPEQEVEEKVEPGILFSGDSAFESDGFESDGASIFSFDDFETLS